MGTVDRPRITDLSRLEMETLMELSRVRVTMSSVKLTAEIFPTMFPSDDPIAVVDLVLGSLADRGLITYRIKHIVTGEGSDLGGPMWMSFSHPQDIRLTQLGWELMGHPTIAHEIGRNRRIGHNIGQDGVTDESRHPGDPTDFRNHKMTAEGFPIERMSLDLHCEIYRDHAAIHAAQRRELLHGVRTRPQQADRQANPTGSGSGLDSDAGRPRSHQGDQPGGSVVLGLDDGERREDRPPLREHEGVRQEGGPGHAGSVDDPEEGDYDDDLLASWIAYRDR